MVLLDSNHIYIDNSPPSTETHSAIRKVRVARPAYGSGQRPSGQTRIWIIFMSLKICSIHRDGFGSAACAWISASPILVKRTVTESSAACEYTLIGKVDLPGPDLFYCSPFLFSCIQLTSIPSVAAMAGAVYPSVPAPRFCPLTRLRRHYSRRPDAFYRPEGQVVVRTC